MSPSERDTSSMSRLGSLRVDPLNECLWDGERSIPLRPKAWNLLAYLLANPGRILTKQELLDAVWADAVVGDAVLKVCVRELRRALGGAASSIQTVHRRGYRFVPDAAVDDAAERAGESAAPAAAAELGADVPTDTVAADAGRADEPTVATRPLVGRDAALARLVDALGLASKGSRQLVFVGGDAGLGKTALVETLLASAAVRDAVADGSLVVAQGQCSEQFGSGEPYMPLLEAFAALCRGPARETVVEVLRDCAPTWLVQMPWLVTAGDRPGLEAELLGATSGRMLREMTEALDALSRERTLVLWLEDLHWSDDATLDLLAAIARRPGPARLLVLGSFRPVEVIVARHGLGTLRQQLEIQRRAVSVHLELLEADAVHEYLARRLDAAEPPPEIAPWLHGRTGGNPLFLESVVDDLLERGLIVRDGDTWALEAPLQALDGTVPESLRWMIEAQVEQLEEPTQRVLEAAAVNGVRFASEAVAAALEIEREDVERRCEALRRAQQFLRASGADQLPDGTLCERYEFRHELYRHVLQARVAAGRRCGYHLRIAERGVQAWGDRVGEISTELAIHFEAARALDRAVEQLRLAADSCVARYANREAVAHLEHALGLLVQLADGAAPERPDRPAIHRAVLEALGDALMSMGRSVEAADAFAQLAELADTHGRRDVSVRALLSAASALSWHDREACLAVVDTACARSAALDDELLVAHVSGLAGYWHLLWHGWRDQDEHASRAAIDAAEKHGDRDLLCLHVTRHAWFACLRADYVEAMELAARGRRLAGEVRDSLGFLVSHFYGAWGALHAGRWGETRQLLESGLKMADRNGHALWAALFRLQLAWLSLEGRDGEQALTLVAAAREATRAAGHPYGERLAGALHGRALLGTARVEEAVDAFAVAQGDERRVLMDWVLEMPLADGAARAHLACGDTEGATQHAERLLASAAACGEQGFAALAHRSLARAAGDAASRERHVSAAVELVDDSRHPLAAWRVHATAATLRDESDPDAAREHRQRGGRILMGLLDSMSADDPLRESLSGDTEAGLLLDAARAAG